MPMVEAAVPQMDGPAPLIVEVPDAVAGHQATGTQHNLRRLPRHRRRGFRMDHAAGRMGKPCAELHFWHDGAAQRGGLPPPWGLSDDHGHADFVATAAVHHIPANCAAVSL